MEHDIDVQAFWRENSQCMAPFSTAKPRVPLTYWLDDHFMHGITDVVTARYFQDFAYRLDVHRECNRRLLPALGRGPECYPETYVRYHKGQFEVVCGARRVIEQDMPPWLESDVTSIDDVKRLITRLARLEIKKVAVTDEMREVKQQFTARTGARLVFEHSWTGPATMACSILGTTNVCYFMLDETDVMEEFMTILAEKYIEYREAVVMEDNGLIDRAGIGVNDDCCYLFPPKLHERLCAPFLAKWFAAFAPRPEHRRRQHSDSAMGHLMPILNDLGVNEVNFGPTVDIRDIRMAMPHAVIHGQMPPFLLRDGSPEQIIAQVRQDIERVGSDGGLVECPSGNVAVGTSFANLRVYMWAVQTYGRYN